MEILQEMLQYHIIILNKLCVVLSVFNCIFLSWSFGRRDQPKVILASKYGMLDVIKIMTHENLLTK